MRSSEEMRRFLADSLEQLLLNCTPEERDYEMREVRRLLSDHLPWLSAIQPDDPKNFSRELFQNDPGGTWPLVEQALSRHPQEDWNPVESAAGPADFVASLLPSDHHLK